MPFGRKRTKNRNEELLQLELQIETLKNAVDQRQHDTDEKQREAGELEAHIMNLELKTKNIEMLHEDADRKYQGLSQSLSFKESETNTKKEEWEQLVPMSKYVNDPETRASKAIKTLEYRRQKRMENAIALEQIKESEVFEEMTRKIVYARTNDVMPGSKDIEPPVFFSEVKVLCSGDELEKIFRLPKDENYAFGQLQRDAAMFWNLDPQDYFLADRAGVVYATGMRVHEEMRYSAKEIPESFDPEDFSVYLECKPEAEIEVGKAKKKEEKKKGAIKKVEADPWVAREERLSFIYKIEAAWWILPLIGVILARALWISTVQGFEFKDALYTNLLDEDFPQSVSHVKKNFNDVANHEEMFQWMDNIFYEAVDWDDEGRIADSNKMVGGFEVKMMRVKNDSCTIYPRYAESLNSTECYTWWGSGSEQTQNYGPADSWSWSPSIGFAGDTDGFAQEYGGSGYKTVLPIDGAKVKSAFATFQADGWVDDGTRLVQFLFYVYNPNYDLYCAVKIFFETFPGGQTKPGYRMEVFRDTADNGSSNDVVRMVFEYGVLGFFTLFSAAWQVVEMIKTKREVGILHYFTEWWNVIEWILILLSLGFLITRIIWVSSYSGIDAQATHFEDFSQMYYLFWVNLCLLGLMGSFMLMKSLKFLALYVRFKTFSRTISNAMPGISVQLMNFMVYYLAFGFMGYELFGSKAKSFSTVGNTLSTMFMYTIGAFDYSEIQQANPIVAPLYFLGFQALVFFVLLNIFVGVVIDSMNHVVRERGELDFVEEWASFKATCKEFFTRKDADEEIIEQLLAEQKLKK